MTKIENRGEITVKAQHKNQIIRRSMVMAFTIALFWSVWGLINDEMPMATSIMLMLGWTYEFPIQMSRYIDVLIAPIYWILLIWVRHQLEGDGRLIGRLHIGILIGFLLGLIFGVFVGVLFGVLGGLLFGLATGWRTKPMITQIIGSGFALMFGLITGLVTGLVAGLVSGLLAGMVFGLGAVIGYYTRNYDIILAWLNAKDVE